MKNTSLRTQRWAKWQALVEEQEASALSQISFCQQKNIVLSQFVYYCGLIKRKNSTRTETFMPETVVPIQLKSHEKKSTDDIKISLPNGFQCVFPCSVDTLSLKRWLEVLLSC